MCHGAAIDAFPEPLDGEPFSAEVDGYAFGGPDAETRLAVLPDIYGCNPFYKGLSTRYAEKGARVFLIDPFSGLGELPEITREAAFARRHKVRDKEFVDRFERFIEDEKITGVVGFCLGGLYVFELARRDVRPALVGLYGFPQGLPNDDPLPVPFDYLAEVSKAHTMLMGGADQSVGPDNIAKLKAVADANPAIDLTIYPDAGHGFLPDLSSADAGERQVAEDALKRCDAALF